MKYTLKDEYQTPAVKEVLENLRKARKRWHEDGDKHGFSLTATTGAGKTVMAAAVIEALFWLIVPLASVSTVPSNEERGRSVLRSVMGLFSRGPLSAGAAPPTALSVSTSTSAAMLASSTPTVFAAA